LKEIEDLTTRFATEAKLAPAASTAGKNSKESLAKRLAELKKIKEEQRMKVEEDALHQKEEDEKAHKAEKEAKLIRNLEVERRLKSVPSEADIKKRLADNLKDLEFLHKGIDVCFLMDCTGSMDIFIEEAKAKIREINTAILEKKSDAIMRFAFVGYRDYGDKDQQHEMLNFIESSNIDKFIQKLASCEAKGGDDEAEDVAGGLKIVTGLSWKSSTRVLIHVADAPCHGAKYHDDCNDNYPVGDPKGLVPEEFIKELIRMRVDYNFMKINDSTDKMTQIFAQVFEAQDKIQMRVQPIGGNILEFVPLVVKSITSSMQKIALDVSLGKSFA